jgi:hypothetical protein
MITEGSYKAFPVNEFTIATVSNDMNVRKPIIQGTTSDAFSYIN